MGQNYTEESALFKLEFQNKNLFKTEVGHKKRQTCPASTPCFRSEISIQYNLQNLKLAKLSIYAFSIRHNISISTDS